MNGGWARWYEQPRIFITYFMPHHRIFYEYFLLHNCIFCDKTKDFLLMCKYFAMWTRVWCQDTQIPFFWRYLFFKMVVLNCSINLGCFWRMETTFKPFTIIETISPSKDHKIITYSGNDFPYNMKLIFLISSLELFY